MISSPLFPTTTKNFQPLTLTLVRLITFITSLFKIVREERMFYRCQRGMVARDKGRKLEEKKNVNG